MRMRSERIVETVDILKNAQFQFIKGRVSSAVGFFFFKYLKSTPLQHYHKDALLRKMTEQYLARPNVSRKLLL